MSGGRLGSSHPTRLRPARPYGIVVLSQCLQAPQYVRAEVYALARVGGFAARTPLGVQTSAAHGCSGARLCPAVPTAQNKVFPKETRRNGCKAAFYCAIGKAIFPICSYPTSLISFSSAELSNSKKSFTSGFSHNSGAGRSPFASNRLSCSCTPSN